jgi:photosystem II stability/assembly factor-like uncharacterized protein
MAGTVSTHHLNGSHGALVLVGTTKGAFLYRADPDRSHWEVAGPYFPGHAVQALAYDPRRGRLYAGTFSMHWGAFVATSDDLGRTWTNPERAPLRFPEGAGEAVKQVWQLHVDEGGTVWAGVEPAALFRSDDGGETFALVRGLFEHPQRKDWQPGGGGLCLHTVIRHGGRLYVAISTAGVYRSDDDGATWRARNAGIRAGFMPPEKQFPEFGQCVHKVAPHPSAPDRLYLQHHGGVYRSDDAGDSWRPIDAGLPSDFGFPVAVHPRDGERVYVVPLDSDAFRATCAARLRVYRSGDGGASWDALSDGLPQEGAYETILRDGLALDALEPAGVYFGTRSGKLYGSADEGASWRLLADGLPPVVCVKTAALRLG